MAKNNTLFYVNYEIRKSDGTTENHSTPCFDNIEDARYIYDGRVEEENVIDVELWEITHREPQEMAMPEYHPKGFDEYSLVAIFSRD